MDKLDGHLGRPDFVVDHNPSMARTSSFVQQNDELDAFTRQDAFVQSNINYMPHMFHHSDVSTANLVTNIASYLTLSDAAPLLELVSLDRGDGLPVLIDDESDATPADSWAVGVEFDGSTWSMETPLTPPIITISPGATPLDGNELEHDEYETDQVTGRGATDMKDVNYSHLASVIRERRRRWAQEKITAAVFSHPKSLRSYCVEAFDAAMRIRQEKEQSMIQNEITPETFREPPVRKRKRTRQEQGLKKIQELVFVCLQTVPLTVALEILEGMGYLSLETTLASAQVTAISIQKIITVLGAATRNIWHTITSFNPMQVLEAIISVQFNAMGKTSEVLASGIQSVATGVGSASSMALYRLSAANLSVTRMESSSSLSMAAGVGGRQTSSNDFLKRKLLRKLSTINDAGQVLSYREIEDDTGGLTRQAVSRTRRMMHYTVPLRPFVATVAISSSIETFVDDNDKSGLSHDSLDNLSINSSQSSSDDNDSPFMCTPQSFPPTPHSRQMVIAQRSQFSDDVVFIVRDRLRIHDGLKSEDERTRERSRVLQHEKRLAVFACNEQNSGIELTCGRHIAAKVGHLYYASTRSMIPVLRNCFVYFEMTVLPQPVATPFLPTSSATLSIGFSTVEMPPNTLVGAWQGSVGLCTSGQILMAGQWYSPADPVVSAYGADATVGCLVYLDDDSSFETWDGVMVKAAVRFNINGELVSQPVSTLPMSGNPVSQAPPLSSVGRSNSFRESSDPVTAATVSGHSSTLTLLVPEVEDLYPTVTIQSSGTAVVCRFSSEDIAANTRASIGAPPGACVYAVDGSVILNSDE